MRWILVSILCLRCAARELRGLAGQGVVSILCLRCVLPAFLQYAPRDARFNSLFEMQTRRWRLSASPWWRCFNSLFEMQLYQFARFFAQHRRSFNSLFEMQFVGWVNTRMQLDAEGFNSLFEMRVFAYGAGVLPGDWEFQFSV